MEERHEIVELLRDNSKDSLEEIVTTLDINPRSYNKSQLAVIIFLFNVSTFPHTPDQIYLELLDGLEQRIHVKDMFIVQSALWTRGVISALSDTKRRNLARILGLADNTRDVRIILNAIDAIKVARTRTLPTKLKLFKSPAIHASSSPYRLSDTIPGLSDEETRQYLAMLAMEQEYRASASSSSSAAAASGAVIPVEFSEWDMLDESEELARRLQEEEEDWLRQEYTQSSARHEPTAASASGGSQSIRMSARADVAATAAGGSSEPVQRLVREALVATDKRYRLNGPELAELERQSNPDPQAFVPGTHFTFRELSDALTIKQGIITTGAMGIHNAFDNFKDLPKALTILQQSSGRKKVIKEDQLPELKKIVIEFAARMDDRPYLSKIDTTVEAYIKKKIDDLIAKVCKYKSKSARMEIKRGGKVISTVGLNDLLHDVMHILRTMHPYFQTRWAAAFIESNESAYGDESLSCADGIVERPLCIFAQELKLVAGEGSKEELKAEEALRKKNLVKQWMYYFFQKIADSEEDGTGDGKFIKARDEPLLMVFIREKVKQDQHPVWVEWASVIETFIKSKSFTELVDLYQGKRRRSKKRRINKRRSKK
jgi:hypothetical protein